jgi:hypothetical protein
MECKDFEWCKGGRTYRVVCQPEGVEPGTSGVQSVQALTSGSAIDAVPFNEAHQHYLQHTQDMPSEADLAVVISGNKGMQQ